MKVKKQDWINKLPESVQPYLRLSRVEKPSGTWLLLLPGYWTIAIAANKGSLPDLKMIFLFGILSIIMRSVHCVMNDMADYKFDALIERTKNRPIASGKINHAKAFVYLMVQFLILYSVALNCFNSFTTNLCVIGLPLAVLYPFSKRFTYYPQFILGLGFNWGILVGYSVILGYIDWMIIGPLYISSICWTMVYDTIYAHQDKDEDIIVGVKSTALKFGDNSRLILSALSIITISGMIVTGIFAKFSWVYFLGTLILCGGHLLWQLITVDFTNPTSCLNKFNANIYFAFLFLFTIIIEKLI